MTVPNTYSVEPAGFKDREFVFLGDRKIGQIEPNTDQAADPYGSGGYLYWEDGGSQKWAQDRACAIRALLGMFVARDISHLPKRMEVAS